MREVRAITITIKGESADGSKKNPDAPKPEEENAKAKETTKSSAQNLSSWLVHRTLSEAESQLKIAAEYEFSKYYTTHDDYIGQRNFEIAKACVGIAVNVGTSIVSGAMVGALAGPVGAAIGAAAGAAFSGVNLALQYNRAMERQQLTVNQLNAQLQYTRQRSGYSLTSGSVGEDK